MTETMKLKYLSRFATYDFHYHLENSKSMLICTICALEDGEEVQSLINTIVEFIL